jgi:hypothetical protein
MKRILIGEVLCGFAGIAEILVFLVRLLGTGDLSMAMVRKLDLHRALYISTSRNGCPFEINPASAITTHPEEVCP